MKKEKMCKIQTCRRVGRVSEQRRWYDQNADRYYQKSDPPRAHPARIVQV